MSTENKKTAVGYVRVSGRGQLDGNGPDRQEEIIREFAGKRGIEMGKVYLEAFTGTEADRPTFMELLSDLLSNGCRTIIVESLDRFARDLLVQSTLLARLVSDGITLLSATTGEDVTASIQDDPMRRALVQIQGVFAELDKNLIVRKLRKAREAARKQGERCEGRKPYGQKEGEDNVIERIRALRRKPRGGNKKTWEEVAAALNAEGSLNRSGSKWTRQSLHKICKQLGIS
jgi:DNA invertase Pin-like site-specific DNA recombinase